MWTCVGWRALCSFSGYKHITTTNPAPTPDFWFPQQHPPKRKMIGESIKLRLLTISLGGIDASTVTIWRHEV